jgi:hypothetical protein
MFDLIADFAAEVGEIAWKRLTRSRKHSFRNPTFDVVALRLREDHASAPIEKLGKSPEFILCYRLQRISHLSP